jgi:hypothetical protein
MNTLAIQAVQSALALALTTRTYSSHSAGDSGQLRPGALPFIGPGTFLVAAYLGSNLCQKLSADGD